MIFEDPNQFRRKMLHACGALVLLLSALLAVGALLSLFYSPALPPLELSSASETPSVEFETRVEPAPVKTAARAPRPGSGFIRSAFVVQDEPQSVVDLQRRLDQLDIVFPDWLSAWHADGRVETHADPALLAMLRAGPAAVYPRLSNADPSGKWQGDALSEMLRDGDSVHRNIQQTVAALVNLGAQGVNVDFEELHVSDRTQFLDWLEGLAAQLHRAGLKLTVDVPLNDEAFDYEVIGKTADAVVAMAYDEHYPSGRPGPIASQPWFIDGLDSLCQAVKPSKLIVALGAYGYDWQPGPRHHAQSLSFDEAMALAKNRGVDAETDSAALNTHFSYEDDAGGKHAVWLLDAVSVWNQSVIARAHHVGGVSLWRLGQEEPAIWNFFSQPTLDGVNPALLSTVAAGDGIEFRGAGELFSVRQGTQAGHRDVSLDGRLVDHAAYTQLPERTRVESYGHAAQRRVALTFDDGPDPLWTPQVLDALSREHAPATFFLVGDQAQACPSLVRRELAEGHLLGNHTFLHPNLQEISPLRLKGELNATQRVIEAITGRQTLLFRPPFDTDSTPTHSRELAVLSQVTAQGYVIAAADVDSVDYARPGVQAIIDNVLHGLEKSKSNVVVLHDAGGDRAQTVAALATLIPALRARGYELVTLDNLLGQPRERLMPPVAGLERAILANSVVWTWLRSTGWSLLVGLFFLTTFVSALRLLFMALLVWRSRRRPVAHPSFTPPIVVVVPAYNEAQVIGRTIDGLLDSDYPDFRILVIDDGSSDQTAAVVDEIAARHPQVSLISTPNQGKCAALDLGFAEASAEFVVTIDADTIVLPGTLRQLIAPFVDEDVDAVCGNVQVGNVRNLLTRFQDVEYVTSQNYDRRAFENLNCISVVPGATGAWKRQAVLEVGGYSADTLTEDADLTLTLLRSGGKIVYATEARSITEAPETCRTLMRQRFRWSYGTLQCLWKHRRAFGRGNLGRFALPNMLLFQLLFPLMAPIGDLVMLLALLRGDFNAIAVGYLLFLGMDLVGSIAAFHLDRRRLGRIWIVLVQRFFYRQFMYIVTFRAALASLRGSRHGWNKLQRQGTVHRAHAVPVH